MGLADQASGPNGWGNRPDLTEDVGQPRFGQPVREASGPLRVGAVFDLG